MPTSENEPQHCSAAATTATLLTPLGRGAIATIAVRGPRAVDAVASAFRPAGKIKLPHASLGRILFGTFRSLADVAEELVVCKTAVDEVEIHCHGGKAAADAILSRLRASGVFQAHAAHYLAASAPDAIALEAQLALSFAVTERTAGILLAQYRGALRQAIEGIVPELVSRPEVARLLLSQLVDRIPLGLHLVAPFRLVIAGQPNVGKSSLINAICGYERAIVSAQAGTTRDVVTATTAIAGWPIELADTAGLRPPQDDIESQGIERANRKLAVADVVLLLVDATRGWSPAEEALIQQYPEAIIVYNKCDLAAVQLDDAPSGVHVSALQRSGLDALESAIVDRLQLDSLDSNDAVPFTLRQAKLLQAAARGDDNAAQVALQAIIDGPIE